MRDLIKKKYPDYMEAFEKVSVSHETYLFNMFICKKKLMDAYAEWLFDILFDLEKQINIDDYDAYNRRVFGFLSERLFNVWIKKNKLKVKECLVFNTEGDSMFGKAIRYPLHMTLRRIFPFV